MVESAGTGVFYPLWKKYKPVILQLMNSSVENGPKNYALSKHEFEDVKPVKNMVLPFKILVKAGVVSKMVKKSLIAEDLIKLLRTSNTAIGLLESSDYTFELDRDFVFHVTAESTSSVEE